jgi:GxxExxY protein
LLQHGFTTKDTKDTAEQRFFLNTRTFMGPNDASRVVIASALKVHTALGAGLLERAYEMCLLYELTQAPLHVRHQVRLPAVYNGLTLPGAYRVDFIVENCLVVEIKCAEKLLPVHVAQVISYLKLGNYRLGLLINFNVPHLRHGIRRIINGPQADL